MRWRAETEEEGEERPLKKNDLRREALMQRDGSETKKNDGDRWAAKSGGKKKIQEEKTSRSYKGGIVGQRGERSC